MRTSSRERGTAKFITRLKEGVWFSGCTFINDWLPFILMREKEKKGSLDKSMEPWESFLSGAGNCLKISRSNIVRTQKAHLADSLSPWKCRPPHYAQEQIVAVLHWKLPLHNQIHAFLWCRCDKQCNYRNENSWLIQAILSTQEGCSCRYIHWGIFQRRLQWERKDRFSHVRWLIINNCRDRKLGLEKWRRGENSSEESVVAVLLGRAPQATPMWHSFTLPLNKELKYAYCNGYNAFGDPLPGTSLESMQDIFFCSIGRQCEIRCVLAVWGPEHRKLVFVAKLSFLAFYLTDESRTFTEKFTSLSTQPQKKRFLVCEALPSLCSQGMAPQLARWLPPGFHIHVWSWLKARGAPVSLKC